MKTIFNLFFVYVCTICITEMSFPTIVVGRHEMKN